MPRRKPALDLEAILDEQFTDAATAHPFFSFCVDDVGLDKLQPQPHYEMCDFIDSALPAADMSGRDRRFLQMEPRGSYKTSVAQAAVLKFLRDRPDGTVLWDAHKHENAKKSLGSMKRTMERNERFRDRYGDWRTDAPLWTANAVTINRRSDYSTDKEPSIDTAGVDAAKTGGHYDLIVADDLVSATNSQTPGERAKVRRHVNDLVPLLNPGGTILLIGTRWHNADVYGILIQRDSKRIASGHDPIYQTRIRGAYLPDGQLYFPAVLDEHKLGALRAELTPKEFAAQYLNVAIEEQDKLFPAEVVQPFYGEFIPSSPFPYLSIVGAREPIPIRVTMHWDPAGRRPTGQSDFHGIVVLGVDAWDRWFVLEADDLKAKPAEVLTRVCYLIRSYMPRLLTVEDVNQSGLWIDLLAPTLAEKNLRCPIQSYHPGSQRSKEQRIELLEPRFRARSVYLAPKLTSIREQLDLFPELEHEDSLDALAQAREFARRLDLREVGRMGGDEDAFDEDEDEIPRRKDKRDGTFVGDAA